MGRGSSGRLKAAASDRLPTLFRRRRWWAADFRGWGRGRVTLRDPEAPTWPAGGERTEDREVALRWTLLYIESFRTATRRRQLKLGPGPRPLGEAADAFIDHRRNIEHRPANTWQNDRSALNHLREHLGERWPTDRLSTPVLQAFIDPLSAAGYAPVTIQSVGRGIGAFLRWLGQPKPTAIVGVVLPQVVHEEVDTWRDEQLAAVRAAADEMDAQGRLFAGHRLAVELGLATGARRNELFAARWERFSLERRTLRLTQQIHKEIRRPVPLKGKIARTALVLPSWWEWHREGATGLVLATRGGKIVAPQTYAQLRRELLERAGVHELGIGYHRERHTYARDFIEMGGRVQELQKSLGHASITTTERAYGHFHEDVAAEMARQRIYRDGPIRIVR